MDYSVGSLSDLITGATTPNKKKVIKKKIIKKKISKNESKVENSFDSSESSKFENDSKDVPKDSSPAGKKKTKLAKQRKNIVDSGEHNNESKATKKIGKKRTMSSSDDGIDAPSPPKKSKNGVNAKRRVFLKEKENDKTKKPEEDPELLSRTVYVGNLPITLDPKQIKTFFMKFGPVDTVRIRGVPVENPKIPKKVAFIKKKFHPDRKTVFGYVRFHEREGALKAAEANGMVYNDHHVRIHLCDVKQKPDESKAIFVGNVSFDAEEEDLWKIFESCGPISFVRIVRDAQTGMGKGFGYVNFENSDSVTLALEMENVTLKDREIRISVCNNNAAKKNSKNNKKSKITKPGKPKGPKKFIKFKFNAENKQENGSKPGKPNGPKKFNKFNGENAENKQENGSEMENKNDTVNIENSSFQGTKFIQKKKNKVNKGLLLKKKKSKQIAPK